MVTPLSRKRTYRSWSLMKYRCYRESFPGYIYHGARGIRVCKQWMGEDGFHRFLEDMGPRPSGLTLERINNEGHYTPRNCCWDTRKAQARNRRNTKLNEDIVAYIKASPLSQRQLAKQFGVAQSTISRVVTGARWA